MMLQVDAVLIERMNGARVAHVVFETSQVCIKSTLKYWSCVANSLQLYLYRCKRTILIALYAFVFMTSNSTCLIGSDLCPYECVAFICFADLRPPHAFVHEHATVLVQLFRVRSCVAVDISPGWLARMPTVRVDLVFVFRMEISIWRHFSVIWAVFPHDSCPSCLG